MPHPSAASAALRFFSCAAALTLLPALTGCTVLGVAANAIQTNVKPAYMRLQNQSIGVMAWADRGIRQDHNMLILDITQGVTEKMKGAQANKAVELTGATFPKDRSAASLYAYQEAHPELESEPIASVVPPLGLQRIIYIEVQDFDLHSGGVLELYRGSIKATIKVLEISGGKATVAFQDSVSATYPEKGPDVGRSDVGPERTYIGTVNAFTTAVIQKFVEYPAQE